MNHAIVALGLLLAGATSAHTQGASPSKSKLNCEMGPVSRVFGGTEWLVYGCDDGRSMVVVSTGKNPASPFYFVLSPAADGYRIVGEGKGGKQASKAAGDDLSRLPASDFAKLLAETQAASKSKTPGRSDAKAR